MEQKELEQRLNVVENRLLYIMEKRGSNNGAVYLCALLFACYLGVGYLIWTFSILLGMIFLISLIKHETRINLINKYSFWMIDWKKIKSNDQIKKELKELGK